MGYANPLMKLPAAQRLMALPADQRAVIEDLMREIRAEANELAEESWRKRKGPMAAYWRAVSTYARHVAHSLSKGRIAAASPGDEYRFISEAKTTVPVNLRAEVPAESMVGVWTDGLTIQHVSEEGWRPPFHFEIGEKYEISIRRVAG